MITSDIITGVISDGTRWWKSVKINVDQLRTFGFLLKETSRLYVQRFEQRAGTLGLTLSQCKVLVYLARNEGVSQAQLGDLTDLEPMTLVRVLDRMESDGWLERRNDPADRRARCLYLKAKGKPLVDEIWQLADLTRREALAGIPKKHADLLFEMLERIQNNCTSLKPLQPMPSVASASGSVNTRTVRNRRERAASQP
jgi:MarR family transcriptional regulator for hemolysin